MYTRTLQAGYTVEAAGVMALIFVTVMLLVSQAFRTRTETVAAFAGAQAETPEFVPEETLRMWSLMEEME